MAAGPTFAWTSPSGLVCPLDPVNGLGGYGWLAIEGYKGLGAAPVTITSDASPVGGAVPRHFQPQPRIITLPVYVEGISGDTAADRHDSFVAQWRTLAEAMTETSQLERPGTLTVARPDGTRRLIDAYYSDGWDAEASGGVADTAVVQLWCPDPYFRDLDPTLITRAQLPLGVNFFAPFPSVSSSQTLGTTVVTNPGSVPAWPTWTLTGPASDLTATNVTRGESFTLDVVTYRGAPLAAGETVVITTSPPSVTGPDGSDWTGALDWPSAVLWQLAKGNSTVSFVVGGASAGTAMTAEFYAQYETA